MLRILRRPDLAVVVLWAFVGSSSVGAAAVPPAPQPAQALPPGEPSGGFDTHGTSTPAGALQRPDEPYPPRHEFDPDVYSPSLRDGDGYFFQYDLLLWSISPPQVSAVGDPASEGPVTVNGITYDRTNSFSTDFVDAQWVGAHRIEFGWAGESFGWLGGHFRVRNAQGLTASGVSFVPSDPQGLLAGYQDANGDGFDDDLNGNHVFGRSGEDFGTPDSSAPSGYILPYDSTPDAGAAADTGDLVTWLVTFGSLTATNVTTLNSLELMGFWRQPTQRGRVDWYLGARYLQLDEQFDVTATGGTLDASNWNTALQNHILGLQFGGRWVRNWRFIELSAEGRFAPSINYVTATQVGQIGTNLTNVAGQPAALSPTAFNHATNSLGFSPLGEYRLGAAFHINPWCACHVGYTGMVVGGVSRASNSVVYELPSFGLTDGGRETLFTHALTLGVEFNR